MVNLFLAIGLVFVIEGLVWFLFPKFILGMLKQIEEQGDHILRQAGAGAVAFGVLIIWLAL